MVRQRWLHNAAVLGFLFITLLLLLAPGCGGDNDITGDDACDGTPAQCLRTQTGWAFEGVTVSNGDVGDVSVVRLADGRWRLYGGRLTNEATGDRVYHSYTSTDGRAFTEDAGYRLTGARLHGGYVVRMAGGGYRMYYADQNQMVNGRGATTIRSAYAPEGLAFTIEAGARLTYAGTGNEADGVGGARPVQLPNGTYRMYYHGHAGAEDRLLSATSTDGLTWTREAGVRLESASFCPPEDGPHNISPVYDAAGNFHLFVTLTRCTGNYVNAKSGIWDATSSDGLSFTFPASPVVSGYYRKSTYHGNPGDEFISPQDPAVMVTSSGLRMFFGLYWAAVKVPESAIYSMSR